jgi:hypothetical protein
LRSRLRRERVMDPAITEAVVCFKRYRCESIKIENEMLINTTRRKITETQALIVKADRLLDDFHKVWARQ